MSGIWTEAFWTWQRLLRLIYFQGHFCFILIRMGTTDINRRHLEVSSSEHLGKEVGTWGFWGPTQGPLSPQGQGKYLSKELNFPIDD